MFPVPAIRTAHGAWTRPWAFVLDAGRRLTLEQTILALAFGVAWGLSLGIFRWSLFPEWPAWKHFSAEFLSSMAIMVALLVAMAMVESWAQARPPGWRPYALAAAAATLIGSALAMTGEQLLGLGERFGPVVLPAWALFLATFSLKFLVCGLAVLALAHRRIALGRIAALRAVQLEHANLVKQTHESRLQAMQARVEPQFLFNTLAQVEHLYETEANRADRMLDDLIVYLRAALPELRKTTSTVAKEVALARAYLNIAGIHLGDRLESVIEVPDDALDLRFPPMVLLPLIDHAIAAGTVESSSRKTIKIEAAVDGAKLRLVINYGTERAMSDNARTAGIQAIRDRLQELYGEHGRIDLRKSSDADTQITLEIPCERS
jgi:hypothetical protein